MSINAQDYGLLLNKDIKLHRWEFEQMVKLLGINCIYRAPRKSKDHDIHGELDRLISLMDMIDFYLS